ncbi:hypothetical protein niasHT_013758 [Heterodera trifolii]|uniref:MADF domain-containing protein n=1 Tax=Heterodera trifolii TaxID=157864 RepID=A0ABD2L8Y0_9BILA
MKLLIFDDYEAMSAFGAQLVAGRINNTLGQRKVTAGAANVPNERPLYSVGLPTGGTPLGMYRKLTEMHKAGQVSFANVVTFNMDEYVGIPRNHPHSYHTFMFSNLFRRKKSVSHHQQSPSSALLLAHHQQAPIVPIRRFISIKHKHWKSSTHHHRPLPPPPPAAQTAEGPRRSIRRRPRRPIVRQTPRAEALAERNSSKARPAHRPAAMIEDAIASAINGGGSATVADIALLRNGRLSGASSVVAGGANDDFVRRLVDVVRREPALYDPSHEHYGNKHASAHFRTAIWQRLCKELDYPDDPQALQKQWKSIRDKYIKEKKRRKGGTTTTMMDHSESMANGTRNFNVLGWLDDYIGDNANAVSSRLFHSVPSTSGEPSSSAFLLTKSELNNSTLLNGGGSSCEKHILSLGKRGAAMTAKPVTKRQHNGGGECTANGSSPSSSAGSEISVGSAAAATVAFGGTAAAGGGGQQQQHPNAILLPQLRHLPTNVNGVTTNGNNNTFGSFNGTASSAGVGRLLRARHGIGSNSHHDQLQQIGGGQHQLQHQFGGGRLSLHHQQPKLEVVNASPPTTSTTTTSSTTSGRATTVHQTAANPSTNATGRSSTSNSGCGGSKFHLPELKVGRPQQQQSAAGDDAKFRKREHAKTEQVVGRDGGRRKTSDERHRRLTAGARRAPANQSTACGSRADFFRSP